MTLKTWGKCLFWGLLLCAAYPFATPAQQRISQRPPRSTTRSPHGSLNLSCEDYHTFTSWKPIRNLPEFDHNKTRFPLRGLHQRVDCLLCHTKPVFTNVGSKCADCHADIHRRQMGAQCEQCHTVKGWRVSLLAVRQHQNRFPLLGAHAAAECESCHTSAAVGQFFGLSAQCMTCHLPAFQRATMPDHRAAQLPTTCEACHTMDAWPGAKFDHARFTGFALTGKHAQLNCMDCHTGGHYQGTSANCFNCHATEFVATKNPDHVKAGFPQDCSRCHTTAAWQGAQFDHNTFTTFPLTGAHVNAACTQCHANGRFAGTPKNCAACHLADFQKTTNPNHVAAGFPQDCSICHSTAQWRGAKFNHSNTRFPLTGAHVPLACASCHVGGKYTGLDPACVSCHLTNFNNTTNPNHVSAGFPQTCATCHSTVAWMPASFNHNLTRFPLTGKHTTTPCSRCHIGGQYAATPTDCYSCHRKEFAATANPNHVAAAFPTTCNQCHTTSSWLGATFTHTQFPIYTGKHAGKWSSCNDCHVNPANFQVFSCLTCHEHNKTKMDDKHKSIPNYVYNSPNCYSCHPQGKAN